MIPRVASTEQSVRLNIRERIKREFKWLECSGDLQNHRSNDVYSGYLTSERHSEFRFQAPTVTKKFQDLSNSKNLESNFEYHSC